MSQTPETAGTNSDPRNNVVAYRCPQCSAEYAEELITRVHISLADDEQHRDMNGLAPETTLLEVDSEGDVVGRTTPVEAPNRNDIRLDLFPEDLSDRDRRALVVAGYNCTKELSYSELKIKINETLKDLNEEPLSDSEMKHLLNDFYNVSFEDAEEPETEIKTADSRFRDLTPKQQSIAVGLINTDLQKTKLGPEVVDASAAYPSRLARNRAKLLKKLRTRHQDESMEEILATSLSEEGFDKLQDYAQEVVHNGTSDDLREMDSIDDFWSQLNIDWRKVKEIREIEKGATSSTSPTRKTRALTASPQDDVSAQHTKEADKSAAAETNAGEKGTGSADDQKDIDDAVEHVQENPPKDASTGEQSSADQESKQSMSSEESVAQSAEAPTTSTETGSVSSETSVDSSADQPDTMHDEKGDRSGSSEDSHDQLGSGQSQDMIPPADFRKLQNIVEFTHGALESEVEVGSDNTGAKRAKGILARIQAELAEADQEGIPRSRIKELLDTLQFTLSTLRSEIEEGNDDLTRAKVLVEELISESKRILEATK